MKRTDLDFPSVMRSTDEYEAVLAEARKRTARHDRGQTVARVAFYGALALMVAVVIVAATYGLID